jgi:hypothetical protein
MDIDRHSRARPVELGRWIAGRKKVYLDACYWIIIRDMALGVRTGAVEQKLLHFLRRGVARGDLICPISAAMFMELMKQPYTPERRIATAALIDELSFGVSMILPKIVVGTEIHSFLLRTLRGGELYPMQELIWTKVSYSLGNMYPSLEQLSAEELHRFQVGFFDYLWDVPLSQIVGLIGDTPGPTDDFRKLSEETNRDCARFAHELRSFEGTYDIELRGAVELLGDVAADVIEHLNEKDLGRAPTPTAEERAFTVNAYRNVLYHAMQKPEHRDLLRSTIGPVASRPGNSQSAGRASRQ